MRIRVEGMEKYHSIKPTGYTVAFFKETEKERARDRLREIETDRESRGRD